MTFPLGPARSVPDDYYSMQSPDYSRDNFDPVKFRALAEKMAEKINAMIEVHPEIEAIVAMGNSGLMLAGAVSYLTGLPQIAVRKTQDSLAHDSRLVNGWLGCKGYVFIDDFISSGRTFDRVIDFIGQQCRSTGLVAPKPVAVLQYGRNYNHPLQIAFGGELKTIPAYSVQKLDLIIESTTQCQTTSGAYRLEDERLRRERAELKAKEKEAERAKTLKDVILSNPMVTSQKMLSVDDVAVAFDKVRETSFQVLKKRELKLPDIDLDCDLDPEPPPRFNRWGYY